MNSNQPKVLITGGSGIVGSHLTLALLVKGYSVKLLVRNQKKTNSLLQELIDFYAVNVSLETANIEWIESDLIDIPSLEKQCKAFLRYFTQQLWFLFIIQIPSL